MATFYRSSAVWVLDYRFDEHTRRWYKAYPQGADVPALFAQELRELFGTRAQALSARPATAEEETQYLRGEVPRNLLCPTGRAPVGRPGPG